MERETLNLKPNGIEIFNGEVNNENNGTEIRLNNLSNVCKVESKRCEKNSLSCEDLLHEMVSNFPDSVESSELEVSASSRRDISKYKDGEVTNKVLLNGVNGICFEPGEIFECDFIFFIIVFHEI